MGYDILEWWNNYQPLNKQEEELMAKCREEDTSERKTKEYNYLCHQYFRKMGVDLSSNEWEITVDNCASNHINKLFDYYVDNDTLVIISNAEHETTVNNTNKCKNVLVLDHSKEIRSHNYDRLFNEIKKYKKVFFYCIATQISTGEVSPQSFFQDLKSEFLRLNINHIMILDAVQEMFLQPRDYSIFDYIIGTGHAICWNYDLGFLIHKIGSEVKGYHDYKHLSEYLDILNVILDRKDKINIFTRCIHEAFYDLLARPEFSIIDDNAPQLCSIRCKNIPFTEEMKDILDKYEIRIEAFGQEIQFIRFRGQMFIKDNTLLLKGVKLLRMYLKEMGYE